MKHLGARFGRLTVKDFYYKNNGRQNNLYYRCLCDCGNEKDVRGDNFSSKNPTKSCGCITKEIAIEKASKMGKENITHGMSRTRIYKSWDAMKSRCDNPNDKDFPNYGGRGISYDQAWSVFVNFYSDMREGYEDTLTLDRKDVNGNYSKDNCRWTSMEIQNNNKSSHPILECNGKKKKLMEWAEELGLSPALIRSRLKQGWDDERILTEPTNHKSFKGAYYDKSTNKWRAYRKENGKPVHVGYFDTEDEALKVSKK